jgi:hypothetical protein
LFRNLSETGIANSIGICRISDSHPCDYAELHLLGHNAMQLGGNRPMFWKIATRYFLHSDFLLGLFFDSEYEGDIFFRNTGRLSAECALLFS